MADKFCITYDNDVEDAFLIHMKDKVIKFVREGCLYCYTLSKKYLKEVASEKGMTEEVAEILQEHCNVISSVDENKLGYTERQFE